MLRHPAGPGNRVPGGGHDPRRLRLLALLGVVGCVVVLSPAGASAGQAGDRSGQDARSAVRVLPGGDDKMPSAVRAPSRRVLGLGLATATRCGPEVTSPGGVRAQTCVLTQGADTWARTYYRNTTGRPLDVGLTLMGPGERTVRAQCAPAGGEEPETCETPREHSRGTVAAYSAVAEFAERGARAALLLRSGSNSPMTTGR
ncbi:hypothetical protein ACIQ9J_19710 [Streptomyces sp. NPDC094153]|uniref:hypothetical protein n=1 Tax=Streptomyces sp. NPDC094153 TaxID=3366058 RepID=UPI00382F4124